MSQDTGYKFDPKFDWWMKDHYANHKVLEEYFLEQYDPSPLHFLEIGVFEGRSMIWMVENILSQTGEKGASYLGVDPDLAPNFENNVGLLRVKCPSVECSAVEVYSEHFLPHMVGHRLYDYISIDGDHNAQGVLRDSVMAWELLRVGGVLHFDDYEMEATDPWHYISHKEFKEHDRAKFRHPSIAIDAFLNVYRGLYDRIIDNFQVGIIKRVELGAKNLAHGDDSQGKFEYHAKKE
jgi:hypothetical protein